MAMTRWAQRSAVPGDARRRARWCRIGAVLAVAAFVAACQASAPAGSLPALPIPAGSAASPGPIAMATDEPRPSVTADPSATAPAEPAAVDPRADGLDVSFGEYAIALEVRKIRPGPVTLVVHNAGRLVHGLEMKLEGSGSGRDRKKIETRTFQSGESLRVEADLAPGTYEIECYMPGHAAKGMRTTLTVSADAPLVRASADTAAPGSVRIVQFAFVATTVDVPTGSRVVWTNEDPTPHTVTSDTRAFDSHQLDPGKRFSVVLDTPGTFTYHCEIHPTMVGTVRVH